MLSNQHVDRFPTESFGLPYDVNRTTTDNKTLYFCMNVPMHGGKQRMRQIAVLLHDFVTQKNPTSGVAETRSRAANSPLGKWFFMRWLARVSGELCWERPY